jgi:hypothetical protein
VEAVPEALRRGVWPISDRDQDESAIDNSPRAIVLSAL